jgi:hypothetical protein
VVGGVVVRLSSAACVRAGGGNEGGAYSAEDRWSCTV